jgi:hypothetical protein
MAVMTAACVGMALVILCGRPINLIHPALGIICAGCLITIARRVWRIVRELESK